MRVLITTHDLGVRGGEAVVVRDLALWLIERGHSLIVHAFELGPVAEELRAWTVPVTDDLRSVSAQPDIIHGNSGAETLVALLRFPSTPAIFVCHGSTGWAAMPPKLARVRRYVAVDDACLDRLLFAEGVDEKRTTLILNAVDTRRFTLRPPLPPEPRRALILSNSASELTHVAAIREACQRAGIAVDVVGDTAGRISESPEEMLREYDLVFAKGKAALEAMASGAAVIVCDAAGLGGMVRTEDLTRMRRLNFGLRLLHKPLASDTISMEIARYDAADARAVSHAIRQTAALDAQHERYLALYEEVIADWRSAARDEAEERAATAAYVEALVRRLGPKSEVSRLLPVIRAANRVLHAPMIGPPLRWMVRRLARRS